MTIFDRKWTLDFSGRALTLKAACRFRPVHGNGLRQRREIIR